MPWLLLVHDPVTIISELGFPAAIAVIVVYALLRITNKFTDFLIRQSEHQSENLNSINNSMLLQAESLREIKSSLTEMTDFWKGLNGKLRIHDG